MEHRETARVGFWRRAAFLKHQWQVGALGGKASETITETSYLTVFPFHSVET